MSIKNSQIENHSKKTYTPRSIVEQRTSAQRHRDGK
jgi:hypothetical protein